MRDGHHARSGMAGVGAAEKIYRMRWCLCEAQKEGDRDFFSGPGVVLTLFRDESKGRVAIRYFAADKNLNTRRGVLGQTKSFGTGSVEINKATLHIAAQLMKPLANPPRRVVGLPDEDPEADLARGMALLQRAELLCVDSASDELLAGRIGREVAPAAAASDGAAGEVAAAAAAAVTGKAITPNLRLVIRDKTHASRRITRKPECADPFLVELVETLFTSKSSIVQRIHNSMVWRAELEKYVQQMETRVATIKNVRAAKHRHESQAKPKGRFCLYMPAFVSVAENIAVAREAEERRDARAFFFYHI